MKIGASRGNRGRLGYAPSTLRHSACILNMAEGCSRAVGKAAEQI